MIIVTEKGNEIFVQKIIEEIRNAHLYTSDGELDGYNYSPEKIYPDDWKDGVHPDITWKFTAGEPKQIIGWYFTNEAGNVLISERFDIQDDGDYQIKREGDKITIKPKISLIAG